MGTSSISVEILTLFLCQCEIQFRNDFWHYYWAGSKLLLNHNPEVTPCAVLARSKLSEYRKSTGSYLPNNGWYDQRQDSRGDSHDIQYKGWLHTREEEEIWRENRWAFEWIFSFQMSDIAALKDRYSCREISTTTIKGNMTMSAVITSWESLTKWQTITFITNGSDELP